MTQICDMEKEYYAVCAEHHIALNLDGSCPECRDGNGQTFPLDMQSYYLEELVRTERLIDKAKL